MSTLSLEHFSQGLDGDELIRMVSLLQTLEAIDKKGVIVNLLDGGVPL